MKKRNGFLYLQLAEQLQQMISSGVYAVGDKLPSVRTLQQEHGISISTALQVYSHLERKGWITSKEKSGYFVHYSRSGRAPLPHRYRNCIRLTNANPWNEDQEWAIQMLGTLIRKQY
ncbi:winged helix-turn-helix domain-containing protein [Chitinophaga sp. 212800010-3]|uniref:winged helix-turn-helix domain-containing protein n=1 Tax=unclassified Chitinophaga TaxID=2619133 RepID=UPI002DEC7E87|nr:hypothetical protein [Chitinophaga sp. 212800010-3]